MSMALQVSGLRPHQIELLQRTIASGCSREEFDVFIETAQRCGLDPFRRHIVPMLFQRDDPKKRRMVVFVTMEGQRIVAYRCGNYRPASEPTEYVLDRRLKAPANPHGIVLARVKVWRSDEAGAWFPVVGEAYWEEFAPVREARDTSGGKPARSLDPASPWARMPRLMIAKCATSQALRAGWPEQFGGLYVEEEMERAKLLDLAASEIVEKKREERRAIALAGKDALTVSWDDPWALDTVSLHLFSAKAHEWVARNPPDKVARWAEANRDVLREFWVKRPSEALELKRLVEARSASPLDQTSNGTELPKDPPPPNGRTRGRTARAHGSKSNGKAGLATGIVEGGGGVTSPAPHLTAR